MKYQEKSGNKQLITIIILVITVLGLLGFIFWQNFLKSDPISQSSTVDKTQKVTPSTATPSAKVKAYTIDDALTGINKLLAAEACRVNVSASVMNKNSFKQVNDSDRFDYKAGESLINNDFTYAFAQYGCGSSGSIGLLKRSDDSWKLVSEDARTYPMCAKVRGQGFPSSIIDKCYVDARATDPVAI